MVRIFLDDHAFLQLVRNCFCLFFFVIPKSAASGDDLESVRAVLEQTSKQLNDATLKGDGETMLSFYTDDAISLPRVSEKPCRAGSS